jgi:hypothetical protein
MRGGLRRKLLVDEISNTDEYKRLQTAFDANPTPETFDPFMDFLNDEIEKRFEDGDLPKVRTYLRQKLREQLQKQSQEYRDFLYYDLARDDLPDVDTCKEVSTLERAPGGTPMTYYYRIDALVAGPGYKLRIGPGAIGCMTTADYTAWDKAVINGVFNGNVRYAIPLSSTGARDESGAYVGPPVSSFTMPQLAGRRTRRSTRRLAPKPSKPSTTARHINGKRRNRKVLKH